MTTTTRRTTRSGRPTKEDSERIASEIETAARDLFVTQGFAATTMEQVIDACGIGKDTLYRRYPTKEALFACIADKARQRALAWFNEADAASPAAPLARVKHLARWFLDANLDEELLALQREALIEAMRARPLVGDDRFTPLLADAVSKAHEAGELCAPDPEFMARQLIAAVVLGPSNEALMGGTTLSTDENRTIWFERAWHLFVNGAASKAPGWQPTPVAPGSRA